MNADVYNALTPENALSNTGSNPATQVTPYLIIDDGIADDRPVVDDDDGGGGSSYIQVGYATANLQSNSSLLGGATTVYFDSTKNTVTVCLQSFVNNVIASNAFASSHTSAEVKSIHYSIVRTESTGANHSYIVGVEDFGFDPEDYGQSRAELLPLFQDILGLLGVPTSTICSVVEDMRGEVNKSTSPNNTSVEIVFPNATGTNFDAIGTGLPIVFQLAKGSDLYEGGSTYTITTKICYRGTIILMNPNAFPMFYTDETSEMTIDIEVTLQ